MNTQASSRYFLSLTNVFPGLLLALSVALAAHLVERMEHRLTGRAWIEALVIAILLGAALRSFRTIPEACEQGVRFAGKTLLELAVCLLGASISTHVIAVLDARMLGAIALVVAASLAASYAIGRLLGLPRTLAALIACGNGICGNSAIVAVAPLISAKAGDVAVAIAFTALLGLCVVLGLPLIGYAMALSTREYGVLSGLTVYAVPQVLAAAAPFGATAVQIGTLVKLVRVMMLGPICIVLGLFARGRARAAAAQGACARPLAGARLLPWYIVGFLVLAILRTLGAIAEPLVAAIAQAADLLTLMAMAGLGLGVDFRSLRQAGGRVTLAVSLSLSMLTLLSLAAIRLVAG